MTTSKTGATAPLLSVDEALEQLLAQARPIGGRETVMLGEGRGRVLAEPLVSTLDVPPLDNSAMDGYAVRSADLQANGATRLPVSQRIAAGRVGMPLAPGTAARIFTGAPVPAGADTVVMQEDTTSADGEVVIHRAGPPGSNIRRAGEDIAAGATLLTAGTRLGPQQLGLAASVGITRLPVYRRLRIATFFTGDELVEPGQPLAPGQIYNSNRATLVHLLDALNFEVIDLGVVPDRLDATVAVLRHAASRADVILTSGGVSVGEEDHVKAAVSQLGTLDLWRIAMKPGKPFAFGHIEDSAFIGLPGNPVSVFVTFLIFARPYLLARQGVREVMPRSYWVEADFDWTKPDRRREFLRARLVRAGGETSRVELFPHQGSGVLTSTAWADGLVDNPAAREIARGDRVRFIPFAELLA